MSIGAVRGPLVGRRGELAALDEHLGEWGGAAVLGGPMGVGKSRLLGAWVSGWEAHGGETIVVRATRSTATVPFGAFAGWVPARLGGAGDRLAVLQATTTSLAGAARRRGADRSDSATVVAVDDAHLLDEGSAALVLHLVQHSSLSLLATVRSGEPCPDAVAALWKEGLATRLDLRPLTEPQTAELLEQVLDGPVTPVTQQRIWHLTQGNPLYVREVVSAARAQGGLVWSASTWHWDGGLRGQERLSELVSDRIDGSGPAARRILELVALGEPLPAVVLERLAHRDVVAEVERQGLVAVDPPSPRGDPAGPAIRLAHPLYGEVLRAELPAFAVRTLCSTLAEAALASGMDRHDPVRVATWLLQADDEPTHADLLLHASLRARLMDDYERSLHFAEAAERAGGGWRATLRRAVALGPLGRLDEADVLLASLTRPGVEPEAHAAAADVRAEQSYWHRGEPPSTARAILAEAVGVLPPAMRSWLLSYQAQIAMLELDLDGAIRLASQAYADAASVLDRLHAIATAAMAAAYQGRTSAAITAVEITTPAAVAVLDDEPMAALYGALAYSFASVLAGRIDEAVAIFDSYLDPEAPSVQGPSHALPLLWSARAALVQGRLRRAVELCRRALTQVEANHYGRGTWVAQTLAMAAAQTGDVDTAAGAVAWIETHPRPAAGPSAHLTELARAWLLAAQGRLSAARDIGLASARRAGEAGAWAVEAVILVDVVRFGATGVAARLSELAGLVEGPFVATAAGFARALESDDGDGLDQASARFAAIGARLHAAEAATLAAMAHAAAGLSRRRAASLDAAQRFAGECPGAATPLLARLDQAPLATTLTDREREVAELAARGRTSREIARALSISIRTVHSHLNHAYTKLGTSDRAYLADALGLRDRILVPASSGTP